MLHRNERVADAVKNAVAEIVLNELSDPKLGFVTVTRAHISRDLRIATIYFSVLGDAAAQEQSMARLEHARGFIRRRLRDRVNLRYLPELRFRLDEILAQEQRVGTILDDLFPDRHPGPGQDGAEGAHDTNAAGPSAARAESEGD